MFKSNKTRNTAVIIVMVMLIFSTCINAKQINSPEALKEYLDSQSANSPDKPIRVAMSVNDLMLGKVVEVLNSVGKYVSLDLSRSGGLSDIESAFEGNRVLTGIILPKSVTSIGYMAFSECNNLNSITIPGSVTGIGAAAFYQCISLTSVTFQGTGISIEYETYLYEAFPGDLRDKYLAGGSGTYNRASGGVVWTKQ